MRGSPISRLILYVHDLEAVAAFYEKYFGFERIPANATGKLVLKPTRGGCALVLLRAAKSQRAGQSLVKIVFDEENVAQAKEAFQQKGLSFGSICEGPGYEFCNSRDPAKNLIQISSAFLCDGA